MVGRRLTNCHDCGAEGVKALTIAAWGGGSDVRAGALAGAALLVVGQAGRRARRPLTNRPPYQFTVRAAPVEKLPPVLP